jgi:hypothetical protein
VAAGGDCQVVGVEGIDLARVRADATMLHEHLLTGGRLGVGPIRSQPVRRARYLVDRVRVDGMPCRDAATLARLAAWAYVREQLDRLDAEWAATRTPSSGSVRLRVAEYEDLANTLQAVLRLEQAREAAARSAALVPGLAPPDWEDDVALGELLQSAEASTRARRLRAAQRALDDAQAPRGEGPLPPRGGGAGERGPLAWRITVTPPGPTSRGPRDPPGSGGPRSRADPRPR